MSDLTLVTTTTRAVSVDEVRSLISGTGALTWSWWGDVAQNPDGTFTFQHSDENSEDGVTDKRTTVTAEAIVAAASTWLTEQAQGEYMSGDIRDAIDEDLGYLDSGEADCVLQMAVLGKLVFG